MQPPQGSNLKKSRIYAGKLNQSISLLLMGLHLSHFSSFSNGKNKRKKKLNTSNVTAEKDFSIT
jgi:hypothetical protein